MNAKVILIVVLAIAVSIAVTVAVMNYVYSDANQLKKEQTELRKRLLDWEGTLAAYSCSPTTNVYRFDEGTFCYEDDFDEIDDMKRDCPYADTVKFLSWCKSHGLR